MTIANNNYRATFDKAAKAFKSGATAVRKQMQIMLVAATEHRVATIQNNKGGDASLLTKAYYLAREAKVIRASEIVPYLEKFAGVAWDDSDKRKTDDYPLGQFVPVNGADISTVKMDAEPWFDYMKPEAKPRPLDLKARLIQLAKEINAHAEKPVKGDNIPADMAATVTALVTQIAEAEVSGKEATTH